MRAKAVSPRVEGLESRRLLAATMWLDDGILNIVADPTADTRILIPQDLSRISVSGIPAKRIKSVWRQMQAAQLNMIRIRGGDGYDTIKIAPEITLPVFVDGGKGKDFIVTGNGDDTVVGGSARDRIDVGGGRNYVLGGDGDDLIYAQNHDTVWGEAGNDTIVGAVDADASVFSTQAVQQAQFTLADNIDPDYGVKIYELLVADLIPTADGVSRPTLGPQRRLSVGLVSQTTGSVIRQTWATADGQIIIKFAMTQSADTRRITMSLTNNGAARITQIAVNLPYVWTDVTPDHAVLSSFRGGTDLPWPTEGYTHQDGGIWPGFCYSPLAVFYNRKTGEGVGLTAFNSQLHDTKVSWVLSSVRAAGTVRFWPNLDKGSSASYQMELYRASNMPQAQLERYRKVFLAPFMARKGIPQADYRKSGVWASSNAGPNETIVDVARRVVSLGASGMVQWSPPDGKTPYYEPFHPGFPWAKYLLETSKVPGLEAVGVLINPYISLRIDNGDGTVRQEDQYLDDPAVQKLIRAQRDDLVSRGVTFAFWDMGFGPRNGSGALWLDMLWKWKRVGITVAPESSCDLAGWVTGAVLHYPYTWPNLLVARTVTPNATQFVTQHWETPREINGRQVQWWQDAESKGFVPILIEEQLRARLATMVVP